MTEGPDFVNDGVNALNEKLRKINYFTSLTALYDSFSVDPFLIIFLVDLLDIS